MIPPFDYNSVLPPFVGDPTVRDAQSPYNASIKEFCEHFASSPKRIEILKGFVNFRLDMYKVGLLNLIQWVDGSFAEDKESAYGQEPNDIDVVTIVSGRFTKDAVDKLLIDFPEFLKTSLSKPKYMVDHYILDTPNPLSTIRNTQYWLQLFSHNRRGVWKGMVEIPLGNDSSEDLAAMDYLNTL